MSLIKKQRIKAANNNPNIDIKQIDDEWKIYFNRFDILLANNDHSPQYFKIAKVAEIVSNSIKYYDNQDYELLCYCIMSNHVHMVIKLIEDSRILEKIMHSIKRYSAVKSNTVLQRKGQFWQHESYDHIIRNEVELERIITYVLNNPVTAGLAEKWQDWKYNYLKYIEN